ncbi:MAG: hypothetical protein KDC07_11905 [Chitinophagaceae bacterium]|nr:hypothetical protein [Chitinophagaceae bacterium]MCB9044719.1 hypothetical protein [Chitinophagales bacterium]
MRRFNIAYTLGCVALAALTLQSCNRSGGLDNLNVITKPYSLLFSDAKGLIYSTNDGQRFEVYTGSDGIPVQTLATSGERMLMVKQGGTILFVSDGANDKFPNFNPTYDSINLFAFGPSMIINLPGYNDSGAVKKDRIYLASRKGSGIVYQDYNGNNDSTWFQVGDPALTDKVTSFARQANGTIVAFDDVSRKIWIKPDLATAWINKPATNLPAAGNGQMYIITQKNDIIAVAVNGNTDGIWRSSDDGATFSKLPDIMVDNVPLKDITCAAAPFGKVLIACTKNHGIWRFSAQGAWESASVGLKEGAEVYAISYKNNTFKNEKTGEYVFVGTNRGLYRSDDLGQNWVRLDVTSINNTFTEVH